MERSVQDCYNAVMSDERADLILELLRAIRADAADIKADIGELRHRAGLLGIGYSTVRQRIDRMAGDIEHIRRRLDLVDQPA
jgi:hypothetical protein